MDFTKVENVELQNINPKDYPDFADAFISYAEIDGKELNNEELDILNSNSDLVYELVIKSLN